MVKVRVCGSLTSILNSAFENTCVLVFLGWQPAVSNNYSATAVSTLNRSVSASMHINDASRSWSTSVWLQGKAQDNTSSCYWHWRCGMLMWEKTSSQFWGGDVDTLRNKGVLKQRLQSPATRYGHRLALSMTGCYKTLHKLLSYLETISLHQVS